MKNSKLSPCYVLAAFAGFCCAGDVQAQADNHVTLVHKGGYVAKFELRWTVGGKNYSYKSGDKTLGWKHTVTIPPGAAKLHLHAEAAVFINTWKDIVNQDIKPGTVEVYGTTLNRKWRFTPAVVAKADPKGKPGETKGKTFAYRLSIHTGNQAGAGTDANIYLRLRGVKGESPEFHLNPMIKGNAFEQGGNDSVTLNLDKDIGQVTRVTVRSDMKNASPDWYLHYIGVRGPVGGGDTFDFNHWFKDTKPAQGGRAIR